MRITFVLPDINMGGGTRVLAVHAQRLRQRGHEVVVVATPAPEAAGRLRSWFKGSAPANKNQPSYFDNVPVELRTLKRRRVTNDDVPPADVVIASWWETAEWVAGFDVAKGAKAYFLQGYETYLPQAERMKATWALPMQKIVVSKWLAQIAREQYGDENVCIVPNSVDLDQFHAPVRGKQQIPTVGMLYAHVEIKRCDLMLKAYELARRQIPNLRLVAFGNVPVAAHLPLPHGAGFWKSPPQDQIKQVYSQCDAWLFGSSQEGFGLPIVEAMACRTPVIATPAGAAPELLASGGGTLVKDDDPADMARAIVDMCRMPETNWREVSDAAYRTASSYTWDDASRLFESALMQAIARQTGRAVQTIAPATHMREISAPAPAIKPTVDAPPIAVVERWDDLIKVPAVVVDPPSAPVAVQNSVVEPPALSAPVPANNPPVIAPPAPVETVQPATASEPTPPPIVEPAPAAAAAPVAVEKPAPAPGPAPLPLPVSVSVAAPEPTGRLSEPPKIAASAPAPVAPPPRPAPAPPQTKPPVPTSPIFAKPRVPLITAKPRAPKPVPEHATVPPQSSH